MPVIALILITAGVVYGCRLAGFVLDLNAASARRERFLHFIPLAVLPALITLSILREPAALDVKSSVLILAGIVVQRRRLMRLLAARIAPR